VAFTPAIDPVIKVRHHFHGDSGTVLQRPTGPFVAVSCLKRFLQDNLIRPAMFLTQIGFLVNSEILNVILL